MLHKQAKILSKAQFQTLLSFIEKTRSPERNRVIALLSFRAGLRAKEIAALTWGMVTDSSGEVCDTMHLDNAAAKGTSGGSIPMSKDLRAALILLCSHSPPRTRGQRVISTQRAAGTSAQVIVNLFADWYRRLGFYGCSSHSGRRTFITNIARNISRFDGSLRDVQALARHRSLAMTQRYIELNSEAIRRVVDV